MLKKLFSHTAIYGLAPQITKVASFLALPLLTRDLTATDYGVSGIITAYSTAISVLAVLGLRLVLVNSFFKSPHHYKWLWRQIYGFLTYWNFVYAILLSLLIYIVVPKEAQVNRWEIVFLNVLPLIFFGQTQTLASTYYQINQKPLMIAVRSVIFGLGTVALNIYLIRELKMGYMGWFYTTFIVGIVTNLSYLYPLTIIHKITPIFNFKWRVIKSSLRVSLPTIPHYYSSYLLNNSDKMLMDLLDVSTVNVGKYNVAYTVARFVDSLGTASGLAVGPLLNKEYKKNNDQAARNLVFVLQIFFFIITFVISVWMKEAFNFLIKNIELAKMYPLGIIIVMAYNYRPMYFGANAKIMYAERTKVLWRVSFIAGFSNVIMNLIAIPIFGFEAGAFTTFISLMYMGYAGYFMKVFKEINTAKYYPIPWLVATIILTVLAYFMADVSITQKVIVSIMVSIIGLFIIVKINTKINAIST